VSPTDRTRWPQHTEAQRSGPGPGPLLRSWEQAGGLQPGRLRGPCLGVGPRAPRAGRSSSTSTTV